MQSVNSTNPAAGNNALPGFHFPWVPRMTACHGRKPKLHATSHGTTAFAVFRFQFRIPSFEFRVCRSPFISRASEK
jgi:hypothetical protein